MYFASPVYLWGLLGLLIPLIIHLWSNKEVQVIKVGSIKMFQEGESRNSSNLRLNELWLLLLRMLAIVALVLIMAELRVEKDTPGKDKAYYFEEIALVNPRIRSIADSLSKQQPVFLFKDGFPVFEKDEELNNSPMTPDYWQLAKSLEKESYDSAVVFSAGYLKGLKGKKPEIAKHINWINIELRDSIRKPLVVKKLKDSMQLVYGIGNSHHLFYEKEMIPSNNKDLDSIPGIWSDPYRIQLFYDDSLKGQVKYFHSALKAIQNYSGRNIQLDTLVQNKINPDADLLIWLSDKEIPDFENKVLEMQADEYAKSLITQGIEKNRFYLTQTVSAENIQDYRFSEELLELVIPSKEILELSEEIDKRKVPEIFLETEYSETEKEKNQILYSDLSRYLWILLFILLTGERVLAKMRRQ